MQINRDLYLDKLVHAIGNQMIKVVSNIGYSVNAQGYTERRYNSIPRYVMFSRAYRCTKKPKK